MRTKFVGWGLPHRDNLRCSRISVSGIRLTGRGFTPTEIILLIFLICILFIFLMIRDESNPRRLYAFEMKQKVQFRSIDCALELFKNDFGYYPQSGTADDEGQYYCGAMKLCEALMGQDLMGFHPDSVFRSDGTGNEGNVLYPKSNTGLEVAYQDSLKARKGPYLPLECAIAHTLADLYGENNTGLFDPNNYVLCDAFENIYNYKDNHALLALGVPGKPGQKHPLYEDPKIFYEIAINDKVADPNAPFRADTFILLSAGHDGLYGTKDDIANFDFRWRRE